MEPAPGRLTEIPGRQLRQHRPARRPELAACEVHRRRAGPVRRCRQRQGLPDDVRRLQALQARKLHGGLSDGGDHPHRVRHGLHTAGCLQRLQELYRRLPLQRHRPQSRNRHGAQVHALLRTTSGRPTTWVRESVPHLVHPVRAARGAPTSGRRPACGSAFARRHAGSAVWPRRQDLRRFERLLPSHGQAGDLRAAKRRKRKAAQPQRRRWVRRRPGDSGARRHRRHRGVQAARNFVIYLAAEHFVRAPQWTWYILGYFFFAGLTGGCYALATLLRLVGDARDEPAARVGFYASFATLLVCPVLLTTDLGASWWKFWHMLVDVTPGDQGLNFKYWSPMSVGVWALLIFGFFVAVSALEAFVLDRRSRSSAPKAPTDSSGSRFRTVDPPARPIGGIAGQAFNVIGGGFALFVASYTGGLLSVSNQPIWGDTWMLGGLFLASGLSGSAPLFAPLAPERPPPP